MPWMCGCSARQASNGRRGVRDGHAIPLTAGAGAGTAEAPKSGYYDAQSTTPVPARPHSPPHPAVPRLFTCLLIDDHRTTGFGEQTRGPPRCVRWMPVRQMHIAPRRGNGKGVRGERSWTLYALRGGRGSISSLLRCAVGELSLLRRHPLPHLCGCRGRSLFAGDALSSSTGLPSSTSEHHRASLRPPSFEFFGQLYSTCPPRREASCNRLHGAACSDGPPSPAHHAKSRSCQIPVSIRLARGPVRHLSLTVPPSDGRINWPYCHALRMPAAPDSGPQTAAVHLSVCYRVLGQLDYGWVFLPPPPLTTLTRFLLGSSASGARVVALIPRRRAPSGPHLLSAIPRMPDRPALGCGCRKRSLFRRRGVRT
jgi:hypothetical protein